MFAPEGYWTWDEMFEASKNWTHQIVVRSILPEIMKAKSEPPTHEVHKAICDKLVNSGRSENLSEAQFAMELMELLILAKFMDLYDAVLCSPDGRTLRCPPILKSHGDALDWWIWPLSKEKISHGEAHGYFEAFRAGKFSIADALDRFVAIDYRTGTVKLKANTVRLLCGSSYGHGVDENAVLNFIDAQIRPIIGWSICWKQEILPETEQDLILSLGFAGLDWSDIRGRSSIPSETNGYKHVSNCVMEAFPDGKGTEIWTEVEKKVGYSRRHIRRALMDEGIYETWARGGHK